MTLMDAGSRPGGMTSLRSKSLRALSIGVVLLAVPSRLAAQETPDPNDLVRISEAYRLAATVGETVWPGWDAPFPVLLVTGEREFLTGMKDVPGGFETVGYSAVLQHDVWSRPREYGENLLATFPAFGPTPVVVIGRPEATRKTSTSWVLTVCHEHFHQYQMSDAQYVPAVNQLGLSAGDSTGMWMLNYPFPYGDAEVAAGFAAVSRTLASLVNGSSAEERRRFWRDYREFLGTLSDEDARYLSFQLWQEGVSRYVELRVAEAASTDFTPSLEFTALPDVSPFSAAAETLRTTMLTELTTPDLAARRRSSFYAFGAGLALLLDQDGESWKDEYRTEKFRLERYAGDR